MSSVTSSGRCPQCGAEEGLTTDFNCKTGEESGVCTRCGLTYIHVFEREENGQPKRKNVAYPRDEIVFIVEDSETKNVLFKKYLKDLENVTREMIFDFLNRKSDFGEETEKVETDPKVINESLFGDGDPVRLHLDGWASIYHEKDGKTERIFYRCDDLEINENDLIIKETIIRDEEDEGNGVFYILKKNGVGSYNPLEKMTLEEAEKLFNEILYHPENKDIDIKRSYATWYNHETKELVELKKKRRFF